MYRNDGAFKSFFSIRDAVSLDEIKTLPLTFLCKKFEN